MDEPKHEGTGKWWEYSGLCSCLEEAGPGGRGLISPSSTRVGWCPQCPLTTPLGPGDKGRGGKSERWKHEEKSKAMSAGNHPR